MSDDLLQELNQVVGLSTRDVVAHRAAPDARVTRERPPVPVGRCRIVLRDGYGSAADVRHIMDSLNALISGVVITWMASDGASDEARSAWQVIRDAAHRRPTESSFYPGFGEALLTGEIRALGTASRIKFVDAPPEQRRSPLPDPMTFEVHTSTYAWAQRKLELTSPELYRRMFSFAAIQRLQRRSPMTITALLTFATALPVALVFACLKVTEHFQRAEAELRLRQADARMRETEADQAELRTQAMARVVTDLKNLPATVPISDALIQEVMKQTTPAIAELSRSPLVGSFNVGLTQK